MGKLFQKYKWLALCAGIILLVTGAVVIAIAFINVDALSSTLSFIIAAILFLFGTIVLISSFLEDRSRFFKRELIYGALLIALGVFLCIQNTLLGNVIVYLIAVMALAFGVVMLIQGIFMILYHAPWYTYVICFIIAAISITFGIVALVNVNEIKTFTYVFLGAALAAFGVAEIVYGAKIAKLH